MSDALRVDVIAECGSVHDGSLGNALRLADVAADCGADVVKFQTHFPEAETLPDAPAPAYFKDESRFEYFQRTSFSQDEWFRIKRHCDERGIEFMSSPFSEEAVSLLETLDVARYKIPSGEVTNIPLLKAVAKTGKPVLMSSGMSSWEELDEAVAAIRSEHGRIVLLQCTSIYPCPPEEVGLNVLDELRERFDLPVGFSDHTSSNTAAIAAVTKGAVVVEKHLTFSKSMYGSDARFAAEPGQFQDLVRGIRELSVMLNHPRDKNDLGSVQENKEVFEKSLVALTDLQPGQRIDHGQIGIKKPGTGLSPAHYDRVVGSQVIRSVPAGSVLKEGDVDLDQAPKAND